MKIIIDPLPKEMPLAELDNLVEVLEKTLDYFVSGFSIVVSE